LGLECQVQDNPRKYNNYRLPRKLILNIRKLVFYYLNVSKSIISVMASKINFNSHRVILN
jgi:hypothetical protein